MKTTKIIAAAVLAFSLIGCSDNEDMPTIDIDCDIAAVRMNIYMTDRNGTDLLDPDKEGSMFGYPMTLEHNGKSYSLKWELDVFSTPYIDDLAMSRGFFGLQLCGKAGKMTDDGWTFSGDYLVALGDLEMTEKDWAEDFILKWDDNQRIENIRIINSGGKISYYLNNKECERNIVLVK